MIGEWKIMLFGIDQLGALILDQEIEKFEAIFVDRISWGLPLPEQWENIDSELLMLLRVKIQEDILLQKPYYSA